MKCLGGTFTRGPSLDMRSPASLGPGYAEPLGDYKYCAHKYFKLMLFDFMYRSHSAAFVLIFIHMPDIRHGLQHFPGTTPQ